MEERPMSTYLDVSKTYQEQLLGMIEQSQKLAVDSVSAWAKAAKPLAKAAPATPAVEGAVSPKELLDNSYSFATKLLHAQHEYLSAVLAAAEPAVPKATPVAK
ncbi:MAG TPA: hypothetical protein VLB81_13780 [Gaiellales bacterium]|nr:hypothetical protein [Gaiellales bacterium]